MKKRLPLVIGIIVALVIVCAVLYILFNKKSPETNVDNDTLETVVETDEDLDSDTADCEKTIQKYLDKSDKQWEGNEVKAWDNIVVDYIWRLEDGTVFDTSIKLVAEACGTYDVNRDYTQGLSFQAWASQVVKWFDDWVIWMKIWQTKTVQFWPEDGYGMHDESLVTDFSADEIWNISQFKEGDLVSLWMGYTAKVLKVTDKSITLDFNHELAGKTLIFDITLKENIGSVSTDIQPEND